MAGPKVVRPWRTLGLLTILVVGLMVWTFWPSTPDTPRLGLDLQGGTQVTLVPKSAAGEGPINDDQLNQAVEIIRQRVNGLGVAEAEVTVQGSGSNAAIIVSVPGLNRDIRDQISQTAQLNFRPVIQEGVGLGPAEEDGKADDEVMRPPIQSPENNTFLQNAYADLDCQNPDNLQGGVPDNPEQWLVTCHSDGIAKYLTEPAFILGTMITNAEAVLPQQGAGGWQVSLDFDSEGAAKLAEVSSRLVNLPPPQNQFAIVLDGLVVSAPYFSEAILGGQASINGNFTAEEARDLANVLKYGALPISLDVAEVSTVSPTLGEDQLRAGLIAGAIGMALVTVYLLFYYRILGLVAIVSLFLAAILTYGVFVIMSNTVGLALTLAGIAGAIVAIGITADSFIVYFERIRDHLREGKTLRVACELGWVRARNTLLAADFVSLLAAAILYYLSVGNVRGFAFVLGLTTIIDVICAFWFTRPLVAIIARTAWFQKGGKLTGMSPDRVGVDISAELARPGRKHRTKESASAFSAAGTGDNE